MSAARLRRTLFFASVSVLAALGAAELAVRVLGERFGLERSRLWELRAYVVHGQSRYEPKAFVGWTFSAQSGTNASGFLGPEVACERTPHVPRIACLGGSTTAGNLYQGYEHSYPGELASVLGERLGRPVEVLNFGIPGWTSAESLVNWVLNVQDFHPDVVVLHDGVNDVFPRLAPGFRSDYTHYARPWNTIRFSAPVRFLTRWSDLFALWELRNVRIRLDEHASVPHAKITGHALEPWTAEPFRRNLATLGELVVGNGGTPVLMTMPWNEANETTAESVPLVQGMREHNEIERALAAERGWPLFALAARAPELQADFVDLVHLSPEGNRRKAELLAHFLLERGLPEERP